MGPSLPPTSYRRFWESGPPREALTLQSRWPHEQPEGVSRRLCSSLLDVRRGKPTACPIRSARQRGGEHCDLGQHNAEATQQRLAVHLDVRLDDLPVYNPRYAKDFHRQRLVGRGDGQEFGAVRAGHLKSSYHFIAFRDLVQNSHLLIREDFPHFSHQVLILHRTFHGFRTEGPVADAILADKFVDGRELALAPQSVEQLRHDRLVVGHFFSFRSDYTLIRVNRVRCSVIHPEGLCAMADNRNEDAFHRDWNYRLVPEVDALTS